MDIAQLPHLPEKTSESSETSDSESDSKDNSGNTRGLPSRPQRFMPCEPQSGFQLLLLLEYYCIITKTSKQKSCKIKLKNTGKTF